MAVNQRSPVKQATATNRTPVPPTPPPVASDPTANGRRKKKKKGKGRAEAYDDDEDDDIPELESAVGTTGLSPELESAHLSANAALQKARASREELEATATELYSHLLDPPGHFGDVTEDYWKSLPSQTRDFLQSSTAALSGNPDSRASTMYSMAQTFIQTGKMPTKVLPGSYPMSGLPFELSDPAIKRSLEAAFNTVAASGGYPPLNYDDPAYNDGEVYSDEEGDDGLDEIDGSAAPTRMNGEQMANKPSKQKNKNKKNKKKAPIPAQAPIPPPAAVQQTAPPPPRPAPAPIPPPALANTPPPAALRREGPPPSSRAAGKQPMSYAPPTNSTAANNTAAPAVNGANAARPSARAASKQPLSNYGTHGTNAATNTNSNVPGKPRPPTQSQQPHTSKQAQQQQANKIWSTNSHEERERIKEFWLRLGEQERRDLVKVEKEAVLRKMKEQQKHSCSCAVCGRKRTAIEEELEVLYDAYYEDLEHYAALQQQHAAAGGPPPPGPGPFPGSVALDSNGAVIGVQQNQHPITKHPPTRGKNHLVSQQPLSNGVVRKSVHPQQPVHPQQQQQRTLPPSHDEEEYDEEEVDEYDEDEDYDDEEDEEGDEDEDEESNTGKASAKRKGNDMFSFSSNFTAAGPGNILTVADDLLKNDGQKFLEMMEQLAERRMQREEDAAQAIEDDSDEEEDDEDEEEEEEDDEDGEEDDEEEERILTEEQKMQEGKRMFSIFAARMFEQRVLQAYRERVAQERQLQLLRELEDEERAAAQKDAKKQNANQKKKDKKKQQKAARDEEKIRRDQERAEEEAAIKAKQEALEEAQRRKRAEERRKREVERIGKEAERLRLVVAEKRKRLADELQRAALEKASKEKERKQREEARAGEDAERRKLREAEVQKEKEAKDAAEKKVVDQIAQQQRLAAAAKATTPITPKASSPSPRSAVPTSSSRPSSQPKKVLTKPSTAPSPPTASRSPVSQASLVAAPAPQRRPTAPPRPVVTIAVPATALPQQPHPLPTPASSSAQSIASFPQSHSQPPLVSAPPGFGPGTPPINFAAPSPHSAMQVNGGYAPHVPTFVQGFVNPPQPQGLSTGLVSPAIPRAFPAAIDAPYDVSGLNIPKAGPSLPPPIGPPRGFAGPTNGSSSALPSPIVTGGFPGRADSLPAVNGVGGHVRRDSVHDGIARSNSLHPTFGVVQRPIAPISRPIAPPSVTSQESDERTSSGPPSRRSPSPPSFLGSKALINDDDELIMPTNGRRVGVGVAGSAIWGAPGELPKVADPRGTNNAPSWGLPQSPSSTLWASPFAQPNPSAGAPSGLPFGHFPHPPQQSHSSFSQRPSA